jgi:hypothetical protein
VLVSLEECFQHRQGFWERRGDDVGKNCCGGREKSDVIERSMQHNRHSVNDRKLARF